MTAILDAGALVAIERGSVAVGMRLLVARDEREALVSNPMVVAQVWRDGSGRQARLATLLKSVDVRPITEHTGRAAGELMAKAGTRDPVDASVVLLAGDNDRILTSDPDDIARLVAASGRAVRVVPV